MNKKSFYISNHRHWLAIVSAPLTANIPIWAFLNKFYHTNKKAPKLIKFAFFTLEDFTCLNFENKLKFLFLSNKTYSIYLKLSFSTGSDFRMAGRQTGFQGSDKFDKEKIYSLYETLLDKIKLTMDNYNFLGVIDGIEISYYEIDVLPELKIHKPSGLKSIPKRLTNKKELDLKFSNKILPLTIDENYYGDEIKNIDKLNTLSLIKNHLDLEQSNKDNINLTLEDKFFKYKAPNTIAQAHKFYIIVISKNKKPPIASSAFSTKQIDKSSFYYSYKHVFNSINGSHIMTALDYMPSTVSPNSENGWDNSLSPYNVGVDMVDKTGKGAATYKEGVLLLRNPIKKDSSAQRNRFFIFDRVLNNITLSIAVAPLNSVAQAQSRVIESKILKSSIKIQLSPLTRKINNNILTYKKQLKTITERNINFGTFDLETFVDTDGNSKVYAAGFTTYDEHFSANRKEGDANLDLNKNLFYLTDFKDSNHLLLTCVNSMLKNKYHNYIFYCHNFGNYDLYFLYTVLEEYNQQYRKNKETIRQTGEIDQQEGEEGNKLNNYYNISMTFRDDQVIKLDLKIKHINPVSNTENVVKITFIDSLNILSGSLEQLAKDYNVDTQKGKFPYSFVNKENLNYSGTVPPIDFFNSTYQQISQADYDLFTKAYATNIWELKKETLNYLNKDLNSLLEILNEFSKTLYFNFNINMTEGMTISRLALNLFLKKYLPDVSRSLLLLKPESKAIPLINKNHMFNFINDAYYGGITEVYIPHGENLKGIDVNSLYPYAALNPLPGCLCEYIESYDPNIALNLDNLFGFFYAEVKTNNGYLGLLPVRTKKGLIFPNGEFSGTWTSEELKFARDNGYTIKVIKGYNFNKVENIFTNYVQDLYEIKKESTGSIKNVSKSLLNNVIGRLGLNIFKPITKIVNQKERDYISSTRLVKSHKILTNNQFLVTYIPGLNKEVCFEHGIDPTNLFYKEKEDLTSFQIGPLESKTGSKQEHLTTFKDVSIAISAMVNGYARIFMNKKKLEILKAGGVIFYSDTDSIFYKNYEIPAKYIGKELGQFKLEYDIKYAYFISNKTYCLVTNSNQTIIKAKGVMKDSLTLNSFKEMYISNLNSKALKMETFKSFELATVNFNKKEVILNYDSYTKRDKIFDKYNKWIDTKPLVITNHN